MSGNSKHLVVVAGPTASGKTSLAIKLAQEFSTEIISCDSRQLYREMSIGTAKPSQEELSAVKHHFIDHISIHDPYDAGMFEKEANELLDDLFKTKDVVIMAGGTGLFIRAVVEGLDELPERSEELRAKWQGIFESQGIEPLQEELKRLDPEKFENMDQSNPQRLMRAIEICTLSGQTHTEIQTAKAKNRPYNTIGLALDVPREKLYERINTRVDQMVKDGLLGEAKSLYKHKNINALKTVGYTELFEHFDGKMSREEAIDKIKQHSRNYAKRQITWFKKMNLFWVEPERVSEIVDYVKSKINV